MLKKKLMFLVTLFSVLSLQSSDYRIKYGFDDLAKANAAMVNCIKYDIGHTQREEECYIHSILLQQLMSQSVNER